jgi:uncharacterized protein YcfJ
MDEELIMKHARTLTTSLAVMLALSAGASQASNDSQNYFDRGRVISSTPAYEDVNTPRRECWTERIGDARESVGDRSYGGAIVGGLVGGILGHQVGKGNGRKAATVLGATTGAIVGDRIDNDGAERVASREVERCRSVDNWSRKIVGYNVVYRYQGREYSAFLPYDPGPDIKLRVNVSVAENW